MIQWIWAIWSVVPLPFLNPGWTCGSSRFMYCWSLTWRILSITLLVCEMSAIMIIWVVKIFFVQFFCVFPTPLLNIFCFCYSAFLSFIEPIFAWNIPFVYLIFLKISLVFPILLFPSYFFALITEEGFLISPCYSLELCIQMGVSFIFSFAFCFSFFTAVCKASSVSNFAFFAFLFLGDGLDYCLLYNVMNLSP